uniref:Poly(A) RNA polymerase mitochondrial-like central palm domain-containing protein n=1 Tax=Timema bartmani TaxID=61472 RepID=A0A7R9ERW6_9NEOP|nr:unnamed protein product [Timema bartmani]
MSVRLDYFQSTRRGFCATRIETLVPAELCLESSSLCTSWSVQTGATKYIVFSVRLVECPNRGYTIHRLLCAPRGVSKQGLHNTSSSLCASWSVQTGATQYIVFSVRLMECPNRGYTIHRLLCAPRGVSKQGLHNTSSSLCASWSVQTGATKYIAFETLILHGAVTTGTSRDVIPSAILTRDVAKTSPPSFPEKECVPSPSPTKPDSLLDNYLNTDSMVFKLSLPSPELDKAEEVLLNTDRLLRYTRQQLLDVQSNAELQDFAGGGSQAVLVNRENSRIYAQQLVDAKMQNLVNDWTIRTQGFTQSREAAHCRNSVVRKKHNTPVGSSSNMFHPLISTPSRHMSSSRVSEEGPVQVPNKTAQGFSEKMGLFTSSSTILGEKHGRLSPEINIGQCGKTTETVLRASPHTANRKYSPKRLSKVKPRKVQKVSSPPIKQSISDIARPSSTHSADITKLYHHLNGLRQRRSPERRMSNLKSREEKGRDDVSICSVCRCENSGNLNDVSVQYPPKDMKVQVNPPNSVIVKVVAKETKGITQNDTPPAWLNRLQIQELPSLTIKRGLTVHKPLIFHIPPAGVNLISAPRDNIGLRDFSHSQVQIEEEEQWQKPTMNKPTRGRNLDNIEASTVDIKREPICLCKDRRKEKLLKDGKFELALNHTENFHDKYSLNTGAKPKNFAQTPTEISDTLRHEKISKQKKGVRFETAEKEAYQTIHYSLKRAVLSPRKDTANGSSSNNSSTNLGYNPDSSISLSSIQSPSIDSARNGLRSAIKFLESKSESGPYKNREYRIDEVNQHISLGTRRDELASSIPVTASRVNTNNGPHTEVTKAWPEELLIPPDVMTSATIALHQKLLGRNTLRETTSESSKEEILKELQTLEADKRSSHHELDQNNQPLVNKEIENYKMSQAETQDSEEGNDQERVDEEPEYEDDWDEDVEENTNTKEKTSNSSTSIPGTPDEGHVVNESSRSPHRIHSQTSPSRLILTAPIKPVRSLSPRDHSDSFPPSEELILSVHSISSAPSVHTSPSHHSVHAQISFDVPVCAALVNSPVTSTVTIHKPYVTSSYQQTCHKPKTASLSSQSTQTHTSTRVSNFEITPLLLDKASEIDSTLFEKRPGSSLFQGTSLPVTTVDNNLASAPPLSEEVEPSIPPLSLEAGASVHQTPRLCCATKQSIITSEPSTITVTSGFNTTTPALDHNQTGAPSHQRFPSADLSNYPSLHNFANYHPYGWVSVDSKHYTIQPTPMIPNLSGHVPLLPYGAVPTPILMDHPVEYRLVSTEQDVSGPSRNPRLSPSSPRPHRQSPQHKKNNKTMREKPEPVDLSSSDSANVHESNQTQQKTKHRSTQQATFKANENSGVCDEVKRFREKVLMAAKNKYLKKSKQAVWPKSRPNPIVEVTSESSLEFKLKKNIPKYSMSSSSDSRTESITATDVTPSISDLSEGEVHPGVHGKRPLLTYRSDHSLGEVPHCDCSLGEVEGCKHYQGGDYLSLGEVGHHPPGINGLRCVPDIPVYTSASLEGGHSDVTLRSSLPEIPDVSCKLERPPHTHLSYASQEHVLFRGSMHSSSVSHLVKNTGVEPYSPDHKQITAVLSTDTSFDHQLRTLMAEVEFPADDKLSISSKICKDLDTIFRHDYAHCKTRVFGSLVTGLAFKGSDIDVLLDANYYINRGQSTVSLEHSVMEEMVKTARKHLQGHPYLFRCVLAIPKAKVPLVKFFHRLTEMNCDLSFRNALGVQNSILIRFYLSLDPRIKPLLFILKYWSQKNDLSGSGKLTNYALAMMILFYLQQLDDPIVPSVFVLQNLCQDKRYIDGLEVIKSEHDKNSCKIPKLELVSDVSKREPDIEADAQSAKSVISCTGHYTLWEGRKSARKRLPKPENFEKMSLFEREELISQFILDKSYKGYEVSAHPKVIEFNCKFHPSEDPTQFLSCRVVTEQGKAANTHEGRSIKTTADKSIKMLIVYYLWGFIRGDLTKMRQVASRTTSGPAGVWNCTRNHVLKYHRSIIVPECGGISSGSPSSTESDDASSNNKLMFLRAEKPTIAPKSPWRELRAFSVIWLIEAVSFSARSSLLSKVECPNMGVDGSGRLEKSWLTVCLNVQPTFINAHCDVSLLLIALLLLGSVQNVQELLQAFWIKALGLSSLSIEKI